MSIAARKNLSAAVLSTEFSTASVDILGADLGLPALPAALVDRRRRH
jgi:hypothetical protein